jgi:hypothetical protein
VANPPTTQAGASGPGRTVRLSDACQAAIERMSAKEDSGIDPDTFAEVGEVLFWLVALAEANGRRDPLLNGLRWARNRITHGVIVAAPVDWHYGSELGRLVLGKAILGTSSGHEWLDRASVPLGPNERRNPAQARDYDAHVAGRRVVDTLRAALAMAQ